MAKYHYRISGETSWQGLSGTAILAIQNKANSGKKIDINSVQIYPQTWIGSSVTAGTYPTTAPSCFKIIPVSAISGGDTWTSSKMDTDASDFPSTVQVETRSTYTPNWIDVTGSLTDATIAVNDVTYTPGSAPGWLANQFQYGGFFLNIGSGGNTGRYRITSNTTTALTLEAPGFQSTASATGTVQTISSYCNVGIMKNFSTSGIPFTQNLGLGRTNYRTGSSGLIWSGTNNSSLDRIKIKQGEKIALVPFPLHANLPIYLEVTLTVEGTPNRTYQFFKFINLLSENEAAFSIDNNAGSGQVIRIDKISIGEVGTTDTPYFQLVPIGAIDAISLGDVDKKLAPIALDTNAPAVLSTVCEIFTNTPILPTGAIPQSYIAEGSAGSPRGFNYLNSKDFIGPTYMNFFPEILPFGGGNAPLGNWTAASLPHMTHSMKNATIKGRGAPISLRSGEIVGLVSGAETATAATAVPQSGWHSYYIAMDFSIEDATTLTVTVLDSTGNGIENARVHVEKVSDNSAILDGVTNASGVVTSTYNFPGTDVPARIRVRKSSTLPKYIPYETLGTITSAGLEVTCVIFPDTIA